MKMRRADVKKRVRFCGGMAEHTRHMGRGLFDRRANAAGE